MKIKFKFALDLFALNLIRKKMLDRKEAESGLDDEDKALRAALDLQVAQASRCGWPKQPQMPPPGSASAHDEDLLSPLSCQEPSASASAAPADARSRLTLAQVPKEVQRFIDESAAGQSSSLHTPPVYKRSPGEIDGTDEVQQTSKVESQRSHWSSDEGMEALAQIFFLVDI